MARLLPERYRDPELPGESLIGEAVRRASWTVLPASLLRWFWRSILLSDRGCWCFILGVNNSGTTLLHDLLAEHRQIRTLPDAGLTVAEGQYFTKAIPLAHEHDVPRLFSARRDLFRWTEEDDPDPAVRALHDWGFQYIRQSGRVLLEKSPPNTIRARWLQANFTRPHFIAVIRHPCAVTEGIRRRTSFGVRRAARHWTDANRILLEDLPELDRWTGVRYETLCSDPVSTLGRLARFLSIPDRWEPEDLKGIDVHSLDESVDTVVNFNPRSFRQLTDQDMEVIADEAGELAEEIGYSIPPEIAAEGT